MIRPGRAVAAQQAAWASGRQPGSGIHLPAASIAFVVLLAGCVSPPLETASPDHGRVTGFSQSLGPVDLTGTPPPVPEGANWSRLGFHAAGPAGSWLTFYQPFAHPLREIAFEYALDARASGNGNAPIGLLTVPPSFVTGIGNLSTPYIDGAHLKVDVDGRSAVRTFEAVERLTFLTEGSIQGIFFLVGATSDWSVDLVVTLDVEGAVTGPASMKAGSNATLAIPGGDAGPPAALDATATLEHGVGWTHIEMQWDPVLAPFNHVGVRKAYIDFSGSRHQSDSLAADVVPGTHEVLAAWGRAPNKAGTSGIEVIYAETSRSVILSIMHLPSDDLLPVNFTQQIQYDIWKDAYTNEPPRG